MTIHHDGKKVTDEGAKPIHSSESEASINYQLDLLNGILVRSEQSIEVTEKLDLDAFNYAMGGTTDDLITDIRKKKIDLEDRFSAESSPNKVSNNGQKSNTVKKLSSFSMGFITGTATYIGIGNFVTSLTERGINLPGPTLAYIASGLVVSFITGRFIKKNIDKLLKV